jgi:FtsP/CotA-like multicopper oxidase with cupredoxin domain
MVNNRPFSESYQFTGTVGTVGKWTVKSVKKSDGHPFHIHVNPFQITRKGPDGNDENVWKDTLFVDKEYVLLTRYERFTGKFVMHLDHEDRGMMSLVEIKE